MMMRWTIDRGKVIYLYPPVRTRRNLRWRWYRCWPLIALGIASMLFTLVSILQAWLTP